MTEWYEILALFVAGMVLGAWLMSIWHRFVIHLTLKTLEKDLGVDIDTVVKKLEDRVSDLDESTDNAIVVRCEYHQGQLYIYDDATSQFLVQGTTLKEVLVKLAENFTEGSKFKLEFDVNFDNEVKQRIIKDLKSTQEST